MLLRTPHSGGRSLADMHRLPLTTRAAVSTGSNIPYSMPAEGRRSKECVPALELDDASVLTEGPAIVQYIAAQAPGKQLDPCHRDHAKAAALGKLA